MYERMSTAHRLLRKALSHDDTPNAYRTPRCLFLCMPTQKTVVLRDALVSLLVEQRRSFMSGGALCMKTVLCALLETREASLEVIDAITR